jgi:hypothetical protein
VGGVMGEDTVLQLGGLMNHDVERAAELVKWFHEQGFEGDATAPYGDGKYWVDVFSTEEALIDVYDSDRHSEKALELAIEEIDGDEGSRYWWDATGFYPTAEEQAADERMFDAIEQGECFEAFLLRK